MGGFSREQGGPGWRDGGALPGADRDGEEDSQREAPSSRGKPARPGADRGGPGVAQGGVRRFSDPHWLLEDSRHPGWCSPPDPVELELRRS